jgi:hypothetical protein
MPVLQSKNHRDCNGIWQGRSCQLSVGAFSIWSTTSTSTGAKGRFGLLQRVSNLVCDPVAAVGSAGPHFLEEGAQNPIFVLIQAERSAPKIAGGKIPR